MKIRIENGTVTYGKHSIRDAFRKAEDGYYNLSLTEWKNSRSNQQNALFWVWMRIMGGHFGYRDQGMHDEMIDLFAPIYTTRDINTGKPKQKRLTTSRMNVKQMHEFMEQIDQFAAENSIVLPQPDDELMESIIETFDGEEV